MGTKMVGKLAKNVAVWVHGEEKAKKLRLTTHSFRRSAATSLEEYGISIVALCHAGRWASVVTAQEYQEHSSYGKRDLAARLDGCEELVEYSPQTKKTEHHPQKSFRHLLASPQE